MSCLGVTGKPMVVTVKCAVESDILGLEWESYGWTSLQYGCYMDHVLWEGLYADHVRTNWCFGSKDHTRVTKMEEYCQSDVTLPR